MGICAICEATANLTCSNCCKIFYCSTEHMVAHKEQHNSDCFPACLKYDDRNGKYYYEATRNILQGELLIREESILTGPSPNCIGNVFNKICLGCCKIIDGNYQCSTCQWYLCSKG